MLTLVEVQTAIDAALEKSRELEVPVSVAIVDDGGYIQAVARTDKATRISPDLAISKAYTAAILQRPTLGLEEVSPEILNGRRYMGVYPMLGSGGGIPIHRDGVLIGAVGVAGTSANQCIDCGEAAIAAIGLPVPSKKDRIRP